jgi:hypothetical protein
MPFTERQQRRSRSALSATSALLVAGALAAALHFAAGSAAAGSAAGGDTGPVTAGSATGAHGPATAPLKHASRTMTLDLARDADTVFPLFGPIREREWDVNWKPVMPFPTDGAQTADGAVFSVVHPQSGAATVWVMSLYDVRRRALQYVRVSPGLYAGRIDISVVPGARGKSRAEVTYTMTALSDAGNASVDRFVEGFPARKAQWEQTINHFLVTGKPLPH